MAQNQSIISDIISAPLWQKALFVLISSIIIIFTLRNLLFFDKYNDLQSLKKDTSSQKESILSYKKMIADLPQLKSNYEKLSSKDLVLIHKDDYPVILSDIGKLAPRRARIINVRPGKETKSGKILQKSLYISCEGTMYSLNKLYTSLSSNLYSSVIDKIVITRRTDSTYYSDVFLTTYMTNNKDIAIKLNK